MSAGGARFYRDAAPVARGGGFHIALDGRPVKTPEGAFLVLPNAALADAVAEEWRGQTNKIRPETMALTRLANTAIDRVARVRAEIVAAMVDYGKSDLLCYRAVSPETLRLHQCARWDPLLAWARATHGIGLVTAQGIVFVAQPETALLALERAVAAREDFVLAGLQSVAAQMGSVILALALADGHVDTGEAAALARLDEEFQADRWGRDAEAEANAARWRADLAQTARFLHLLR